MRDWPGCGTSCQANLTHPTTDPPRRIRHQISQIRLSDRPGTPVPDHALSAYFTFCTIPPCNMTENTYFRGFFLQDELDSAREIAYDAPRLRKLNMNMGVIAPD